jgi:hypothetical protein
MIAVNLFDDDKARDDYNHDLNFFDSSDNNVVLKYLRMYMCIYVRIYVYMSLMIRILITVTSILRNCSD